MPRMTAEELEQFLYSHFPDTAHGWIQEMRVRSRSNIDPSCHPGDQSLNLYSVRPGNGQQDCAFFERLQVMLKRAIKHEQMTARQINCLLGHL